MPGASDGRSTAVLPEIWGGGGVPEERRDAYQLQVPCENGSMKLFEEGVRILKEWAADVLYNDEDIDAERGVIEEEWRAGLGLDMRQHTQPQIQMVHSPVQQHRLHSQTVLHL